MKFRCPYCKHVVKGKPEAICPECKKAIKIPEHLKESVEKIKEEKNKARNAVGTGKVVVSKHNFNFTSPLVPILFMMLLVGGILISKYNRSPFKAKAREFYNPEGLITKAENSSMQMAIKELRVLRLSLEMFLRDCGRYPSTREGIVALINNPGELTWKGPYLTFTRADPWKHPYQYSFTNNVMLIFSSGPDGTPGTADDVIPPAPALQDLKDYDLPVPEPATNSTTMAP